MYLWQTAKFIQHNSVFGMEIVDYFHENRNFTKRYTY